MIYKIAIVDDDGDDLKSLRDCLNDYFSLNNAEVLIDSYDSGFDFVSDYAAKYDAVFLDVEMPGMNGLETAKAIRKSDENVRIIFVTRSSQYAVDGYEVSAFDYVLKPLSYGNFSAKMSRLLNSLNDVSADSIYLNCDGLVVKIYVRDICYLEVRNHDLFYHLQDKTYVIHKSLVKAQKELPENLFVRCNSCYLVNMRHVERLEDNYFIVNGEKIVISRPKRKETLQAFAKFIAKN